VTDRWCYPAAASAADARAAYDAWKRELVTADGASGFLRVRRPDSPGAEVDSTVSEGIAYGMILAAAMNDHPVFDRLWAYARRWSDGNGLMHWYMDAAGKRPVQAGAATDADQDMAFALLLAARRWDRPGRRARYMAEARKQIDRVWRFEVDHRRGDLLLPGDSWGGGDVPFNPSYFAPSHYRLFGQASGNVDGWNRVIDSGYAVIERAQSAAAGNAETGLLPAWCDAAGTPLHRWGPTGTGGAWHQYDAARVAFRLSLDWRDAGDLRARALLARHGAFMSAIGARCIVDGYELDGRPRPDPSSAAGGPQSAVFVGCAAVGAMHDPRYRMFVDEAYALLATGTLLARSRYYNLSWTALCMLALTGGLEASS
jgi:endo-1,4-beta-D-glucanase Y